MRYRSNETRGDCPACGYAGSYVETAGKRGRIGWCASCQDKAAIAAILQGAGDGILRAAAVTPEGAQTNAQERQKSKDGALVIWSGAAPIATDDPAGKYLARRGLAHLITSEALRYRDDVPHPDGHRYMALVALVQDAFGNPLGVHRTYLAPDGRKAPLVPHKASKGPIWGGAIRLHLVASKIVIGEGIETSASAGLLLGLPAWAAISAGNMATGLVLSPEIHSVVIAADNDAPGIKAAESAAARWMAEERSARIVKPNQTGQDFNDILLARMAEAVAQ